MVMSFNVNFELEFAKIYPDFTKKLVKACNDLTFTEVKICMYSITEESIISTINQFIINLSLS